MAKSAHKSPAPRKQTTEPTPLPTLAKITNNQEEEGNSGLSEVKLSGSNVNMSDMPTSQPKKIDNNNNKATHSHPVENNIDTRSQPLTLENKEEIKELLRNGMKPKKISEELQPEYPNHQITATRIYELGKRTKNQKTPEDTLVQQLLESLADSSFLNKTKYNKDGDI
ncbi:hypothetical protein PSTT_10078, partial [Puccinia striiformis]